MSCIDYTANERFISMTWNDNNNTHFGSKESVENVYTWRWPGNRVSYAHRKEINLRNQERSRCDSHNFILPFFFATNCKLLCLDEGPIMVSVSEVYGRNAFIRRDFLVGYKTRCRGDRRDDGSPSQDTTMWVYTFDINATQNQHFVVSWFRSLRLHTHTLKPRQTIQAACIPIY